MEKYRVKEIGGKFYPQYRKFVFFWDGFRGEPYLDYDWSGLISTEKTVFYNDAYFNTLREADEFLVEYKKTVEVTYHKA